jgi:hypothetical protein
VVVVGAKRSTGINAVEITGMAARLARSVYPFNLFSPQNPLLIKFTVTVHVQRSLAAVLLPVSVEAAQIGWF